MRRFLVGAWLMVAAVGVAGAGEVVPGVADRLAATEPPDVVAAA